MSQARELYKSLSEEFSRKGIASNRFSELEKLFHLASDNEKLQPEWRKLNIKTIKELQSQLQTKDARIEELDKHKQHYDKLFSEGVLIKTEKYFKIVALIKELIEVVEFYGTGQTRAEDGSIMFVMQDDGRKARELLNSDAVKAFKADNC